MKPIQEIQKQFQDSLDNWAGIMLELQVKGHNREFRFENKDMMNLLILFQEVAHNLAFYKNPLSKEKSSARAEYYGDELRKLITDFCGFDPAQFYK